MTMHHTIPNSLFKKIAFVFFFITILNNTIAYAQQSIISLDGVQINNNTATVAQGAFHIFKLLDPTGEVSSVTGWVMFPPNTSTKVVPGGSDPFIADVAFGTAGMYSLSVVYQRFSNTYQEEIIITVTAALSPGNISGTQTICFSGDPTILSNTASASNGGSSYSYQWQYSNNGSSGWTNISGATATSYDPDPPAGLTADRWYRRKVTSDGNIDYTSSVKVTVNPIPGDATGADVTRCGTGSVTLVASPGSNANSIRWYTASSGGTLVHTGTNYTTSISTTTVYYAASYDNALGCETSSRTAITANVFESSLQVTDGQNSCNSSNISLFATSTNAPSGTVHKWYTTETGSTTVTPTILISSPVLQTQVIVSAQTKSYWVSDVFNGCESTRQQVTANYTADTVPPLALAPAPDQCGPTATFNLFVGGGSDGSTYQWYDALTGGTLLNDGPSYSPTLNYADLVGGQKTYYVEGTLTNVLGCSYTITTRESVTVTINPILGTPVGGVGDTICSTGSITVSATPGTNGNTVRWYTAASGGTYLSEGNSYTTSISTTTTFYAESYASGCVSSSRLPVTATVHPPVVGGSIGSDQTICYNGNPGAFTSTTSASGGDGSYSYLWQSSTDDLVWNDINGEIGLTYDAGTLTSSHWYRRKVTSCAQTAYTNSVKVTVIPIPGTPVGGIGDSICSSGSVTVSATPGTNGTIVHWYNAPSGGTSLHEGNSYTTSISATTTFYAETYESGCVSSSRLPVTATLQPSVVAGSIGSNQTICYNGNPAPFTSTTGASGGDGSYSYQWQSSTDDLTWNDINTETGLTYDAGTITSNHWYRRRVTSCAQTDYTNSVKVTVNPILGIPVGGSGATICSSGSATVSALPGSNGTSVRWYNVASGGSYLSEGNEHTSTYVVTTTVYAETYASGCASSSRLPVTVTVHPTVVAGSIGSDQTIVYYGDPAIFTNITIASEGDGNYTYLWQYSDDNSNWNPIPGATTTSYDAPAGLTADRWYRRSVTSCGVTLYTTGIKVTVTTYDPPAATMSFCTSTLGHEATVADLSEGNPNINWYANEADTVPLAFDFNIYEVSDGTGVDYWWDSVTDSNPNKTKTTVTIDSGMPVAPDFQEFGLGQGAMISNLDATGANIQWFATATGGTPYNTTDLLVDGNLYYADDVGTSTCRLLVDVFVGTPPPNGDGVQYMCPNSTIANLVLDTIPSETRWYLSETGGSTVPATTPLVNGTTYYASRLDGIYESIERKAIYVIFYNVEPPSISYSTQTFNSNEAHTVANLLADGSDIKWYSELGTLLLENTVLQNGAYYAEQTVKGCVSERKSVIVEILSEALPTIISCEKFKPQLGGRYVISGWAREQGVTFNPVNATTINFSEASALFVKLLNHLKDRFLSSIPKTHDIPPIAYIPESNDDILDFDALVPYVVGIQPGDHKLTVYNFKPIEDNYGGVDKGRAIGFQFSLSNQPNAPVFKYETPLMQVTSCNTCYDPVTTYERHPLLGRGADILEFTSAQVTNGTLTVSQLFIPADGVIMNEQNPQIIITPSIFLETISYNDYVEADNYQPPHFESPEIEIVYTLENESTTVLPSFSPQGAIIDGWQRIEGEFTIPADAKSMNINLKSSTSNVNVYFDDVRVHPYESNVKTFVYHPVTQRLMSELDENNYATFYEYDLEGGLVRVKKETEKGIYTIQETRSGNVKASN